MSNFFTSIVHRVIVSFACAADREFVASRQRKCDISGSTRRRKSIETAKYSVVNAEFRYKSFYDAPFIDKYFIHKHIVNNVNYLWRHDKRCDISEFVA